MLYKKKPIAIEAVQYLGINKQNRIMFDERPDWLEWDFKHDIIYMDGKNNLRIKTLEGDMLVKPNNYIIKGVKGEVYSCDCDIFNETYDKFDA